MSEFINWLQHDAGFLRNLVIVVGTFGVVSWAKRQPYEALFWGGGILAGYFGHLYGGLLGTAAAGAVGAVMTVWIGTWIEMTWLGPAKKPAEPIASAAMPPAS